VRSQRGVRILCVGLSLAVALLGGGALVPAQGTSHDLYWWTVDDGGGTFSTGRKFTLGGTIGQPDANTRSGGSYTLSGGFWVGGAACTQNATFLPILLKDH
jgi:hypothetical protein